MHHNALRQGHARGKESISSFLCTNYTKNVGEEMLSALNTCENAVNSDNWSLAEKHIEKAVSIWDSHHAKLAAFLIHSDLDDINDQLIKLKSYVNLNEKKSFITENKRLAALVDDMSHMDALTFGNLF